MISKHHRIPMSHIGLRESVPASHLSSDSHLSKCGLAIRETALEACRAGISVVPILADGSKRPNVRWQVYQQRLENTWEIARWFGCEARGLAFVTGAISGGLEAFDFDSRTIYWAWRLDHNILALPQS